MGDPLSLEDLYGSPPASEKKEPEVIGIPHTSPVGSSVEEAQVSDAPAVQEQAPQEGYLKPDIGPSSPSSDHETPPHMKKSSFFGDVGTVLIFAALFVIGVWLAGFLRNVNLSGISGSALTGVHPTPTGKTPVSGKASSADGSWKTYGVISGITGSPLPGVQFQLPPTVLPPTCDGIACSSQGTYLPGGTRFTIAARGTGQSLQDYRGTAISDVKGVAFTQKKTTVGPFSAMEFTGTFGGQTVTGYGFSRMHGVMIETSPTTSIELNHFTPAGGSADFVADDTVFDRILTTFTASSVDTPTPTSIKQ